MPAPAVLMCSARLSLYTRAYHSSTERTERGPRTTRPGTNFSPLNLIDPSSSVSRPHVTLNMESQQVLTRPTAPGHVGPPSHHAQRAALLRTFGARGRVSDAFSRTETFCRSRHNGVKESWNKVETMVLAELHKHGVNTLQYHGRGNLSDLASLANDFKRAVQEAESADKSSPTASPTAAKVAADFAVPLSSHSASASVPHHS